MDFLHCQQCGLWPRFQPGSNQRYFLTTCGNLYCQTCLQALNGKCPSCQGRCRFLEVNGQASEDVRDYFEYPLSVLRNCLKKPLQILQFQHNQKNDCIRIYGKLMEAYNRMKNENDALKTELLVLKQSNEELKQNFQQLQLQRNGLDTGSLPPMTSPNPTPQPFDRSNRSGNDVFNFFRKPERPVQPQMMVAPVSSTPSPSRYAPRVRSSGFTFPMSNSTPYGQIVTPNQSNQQDSATMSQTPELISRLRNLKCNTKNTPFGFRH